MEIKLPVNNLKILNNIRNIILNLKSDNIVDSMNFYYLKNEDNFIKKDLIDFFSDKKSSKAMFKFLTVCLQANIVKSTMVDFSSIESESIQTASDDFLSQDAAFTNFNTKKLFIISFLLNWLHENSSYFLGDEQFTEDFLSKTHSFKIN